MKIAIINDTHFGVKQGNENFNNYVENFFSELFFPYCKENQIKTILHLGDFFDNRKFLNVKVLSFAEKIFLSKLKENNIHMYIILGNHDVYYKNTNTPNTLNLYLSKYENVTVIEEPQVLNFEDNYSIGMVPWITKENENKCMDFISSMPAPILAGHFECSGFSMMKNGPVISEGLNTNIFKNYDQVLSGHFHTKSQHSNIFYLGTQYEITWSDYNDQKFFHVIDTKNRTFTSVANTKTLFQKIYYDNGSNIDINEENISGKYIQVIVKNKENLYNFDLFVDSLYKHSAFEVRIIETYDNYTDADISIDEMITDTNELMKQYVDSMSDVTLDKNRIKNMLDYLYIEAINSEEV